MALAGPTQFMANNPKNSVSLDRRRAAKHATDAFGAIFTVKLYPNCQQLPFEAGVANHPTVLHAYWPPEAPQPHLPRQWLATRPLRRAFSCDLLPQASILQPNPHRAYRRGDRVPQYPSTLSGLGAEKSRSARPKYRRVGFDRD